MAEKEIILQGEDGHVDELVLTTHEETSCSSLEDCVRMLFPQEGESKPRLRFKGFEGEWMTTKLCQISKKVTTKNTDLRYRITLTNSAEKGIVNQLDYFDHDVSNGDNIRDYYVVENDDFVYNPRVSTVAPVGPINRNQLGYTGVMSPLYYVFKVEGIDKDYLSYFFKTSLWHKFMYENGNSGARFDRFSISDDVFGQMPIIHPKDIEEQRKIASFLKRLDEQVTVYQKQFEELKQLKTACMEAMFPEQGNNVPMLRFKGFEGNWESVEFGSMLIESFERSTTEDEDVLLSSSIDGMFLNSELFTHQRGRSNIGYRKLRKNMLVLSAQNLHLGNANVNLRFEHGLVSPAYKIYEICNCSPGFLHHWVKRDEAKKFFLDATTAGASLCRKNIVWQDLYKQHLLIPPTEEEQEKIASFFHSLDTEIATQQQQLERLKQMKQACFGLLFPDNQSITPPP